MGMLRKVPGVGKPTKDLMTIAEASNLPMSREELKTERRTQEKSQSGDQKLRLDINKDFFQEEEEESSRRKWYLRILGILKDSCEYLSLLLSLDKKGEYQSVRLEL